MTKKSMFRVLHWAFAAISLVWIGLATVPADAQVVDYGKLLNLGKDTEAEPARSTPVPSSPALPSSTAASREPTIADYGLVAETGGDQMLNATRQVVTLFRARLIATVKRLPEAARDIHTALAASSPTGRASYFIGIALFAGLLIAIGRAVGLILAYTIGRHMMIAMQKPNPQGYYGKVPVLAFRVLLTLVIVAISLVVASLVGLLFYIEHEATNKTVIIIFAIYGLIMVVDTLWRVIVAPYLSEYRLPAIDDDAARSLYRWLSVATMFGLSATGFSAWMKALGLSEEMQTAIGIVLSLIALLIMLALITAHRGTISRVILGGRTIAEASWLAVIAVTVWAPVMWFYLLFSWGDNGYRMIMGIETSAFRMAGPYFLLLGGLVAYALISYVIERVFSRSRRIAALNAEVDARRQREEEAEHERLKAQIMGQAGQAADVDGDGDEEGGGPAADSAPASVALYQHQRYSMNTMEDLARRTASVFAIFTVLYALLHFWGGPTVLDDVPGLRLVEGLIDTLFVGYIIFHAVRIWIDQKIRDEGGDEPLADPMEGEGGGAGATRLATLLPLVRNFVLIVVVAAVLLLLLMDLGVNVAPLFAGAGIVGLAIGFGSQTLVRDILSGAFFLMDDAFRKGEYIDVGEVKGTVEKISLRSFQLRHHLGMLHTIPFGEVTHLTNFSRDWVMMKLPLRVTYDTDVERVRKLIKKLGLRLAEDPEIGHKFIQPLKSQGVIMMEDSAMIIRVKFMTQPGEQWVLRKRIFAEIRLLFEAEGIKFAHREVTVRIPGIEDKSDADKLSEDQRKAIGAAARRVGDDVSEEMVGAGAGGDTR